MAASKEQESLSTILMLLLDECTAEEIAGGLLGSIQHDKLIAVVSRILKHIGTMHRKQRLRKD
jgi:hypothetical protein